MCFLKSTHNLSRYARKAAKYARRTIRRKDSANLRKADAEFLSGCTAEAVETSGCERDRNATNEECSVSDNDGDVEDGDDIEDSDHIDKADTDNNGADGNDDNGKVNTEHKYGETCEAMEMMIEQVFQT